MARNGWAWRGVSRYGNRNSSAFLGVRCFDESFWLGTVGRCREWHGEAWQESAGRGLFLKGSKCKAQN